MDMFFPVEPGLMNAWCSPVLAHVFKQIQVRLSSNAKVSVSWRWTAPSWAHGSATKTPQKKIILGRGV